MKQKILVIGLGHQSQDDHIPAILNSDLFELVCVCDINPDLVQKVSKRLGVEGTTELSKYLTMHCDAVDVALVAVPHQSYIDIITLLCAHRIDIIKEKPFATSYLEAIEICQRVTQANIALQLTLQRRHNPVFTAFAQLVRRIGTVHAIEARYVMNVGRLDEGWRASRLYSGGGALVDLGYHYIDLIIWYFGLPDSITCQLSTGNREGQVYDVEDTAFLQFDYNPSTTNTQHILGNLIISRVYPNKNEGMVAFGSKGHVAIQRGKVSRSYFESGEEKQETLERTGSWPSALIDQLEHCLNEIRSTNARGTVSVDYLKHVAFMEAAYRSAKEGAPINPHNLLIPLLKAAAIMDDGGNP